jgi:NTP pyrophosphatase (non-canonical NTP hydrolase)
MNIDEAISLIAGEVKKATSKFPTWPTDPLHAVAVLGEEYGELVKAVLQVTYEPHKSCMEDVRMEAIQVAAMGLRFVMSLNNYSYQQGDQHTQA